MPPKGRVRPLDKRFIKPGGGAPPAPRSRGGNHLGSIGSKAQIFYYFNIQWGYR